MNTRYLTLILRLRLDDRLSQTSEPAGMVGSLRRVDLPEIHYFDSAEKLQEALRDLVSQGASPAPD